MTGELLVISGPSGSGKGSVVELLKARPGYDFSVSVTTRAPREGEREGVNYYYITKERFEELKAAGKLLESTTTGWGVSYGTPASEIDKVKNAERALVFDIETEGAANVKRAYPDALLVMLLPPSYAELERRLRGRGTESEESIKGRLEKARREVLLADNYDYIVINETDRQADAADLLDKIVRAHHCLRAGGPKTPADAALVAEVETHRTANHPDLAKTFFESSVL